MFNEIIKKMDGKERQSIQGNLKPTKILIFLEEAKSYFLINLESKRI